MANEFYDKPLSYEEAQARKEELLEKINQYNLAFFNNETLPYTDEEIKDMQEEYQLLCDNLSLSKEEKILRNDKEDIIENTDGTLEVKKTFFDKVSIWVYIYVFLSTFVISGILNSLIGAGIYDKVMDIIYKAMYKNEAHFFLKEISSFGFGMIYFPSFLLFPLLVIIATMVIYFIMKKKDEKRLENRKVMFWTLMGQIVITIIVSLILFLAILGPEYKALYEDTTYIGYPYWLYENVYPVNEAEFNEIMAILGF